MSLIFVAGGAARPRSGGKLDSSSAASLRRVNLRRCSFRDDQRRGGFLFSEDQLVGGRVVVNEKHIAETYLFCGEQIRKRKDNVAFYCALEMTRPVLHICAFTQQIGASSRCYAEK